MTSCKNIKGGFFLVMLLLPLLAGYGCAKSGGGKGSMLSFPEKSKAPSRLTYSATSMVCTLNETIEDILPSVTGVVTGWSVDPELPAGMDLDPASGVISGTPGILQAAAQYTITAGNDYGSTTAVISIAVNQSPPAALSYSTTACVYTIDDAITENVPTVTGTVTTWSVLPALPTGMSFDAATGIISGTPEMEQPAEIYTITAGNDYGSTSTAISITVNLEAPARLTYSSVSCVFLVDETIDNNIPTVTGTVTSWTVDPALPDGLSLDAATGVISGAPLLEQPAEEYTLTARNSGGSVSTTISITVNCEAPTALSYNTTACVYTKDLVITPNEPGVTGTVSFWSVEPELPHGLTLNTTTGVISGTPDTAQAAADYVITASNSAGDTTTTISITVSLTAPAGLSYQTMNCVYTKDLVITPNEPLVSGTVTSWMVEPALPHGLILGPDGVISGTPDIELNAAIYTITACNSGGSATADVSITVNLGAPVGLSYLKSTAVYTKDVVITPNVPTVTGTVSSWSIDPALPNGLTLNTTTGVITGTPDTEQTADDYTITASNSGGSTTATVSITINLDPPADLSYTTPVAVYRSGEVITQNMPLCTGSASSWSVSPSLPGGLTLNTTTGVISGIPNTEQEPAEYTITATNGAGSTTAVISIEVGSRIFPRFAYLANYGENTVSCYTIDSVTGQLRHNGYAAAGTSPYNITVDPSGKFVYAVNYGSNNISVYTINQSTGRLTAGASVACGSGPHAITVDPLCRFAYVANTGGNTVSVYTFIKTTGVLVPGVTVAAGTSPQSVNVDPSGRFAYAANSGSSNVSVYTINQRTGALTAGTAIAAGSAPNALAVDPLGRFVYTANNSGNNVSVYTINQDTGALTAGTAVAAGTAPVSVTVDPTGRFVYVANSSSNSVSVYTINQDTGTLNAGTAVSTGTSPRSVTVDPSGMFAFVSNSGSNTVSIYTVNQTSGALTLARTVSSHSTPISIACTSGTAALTHVPKFAYTANYNDNSLSMYTIDPLTGVLSSAGNVAAGANPRSVAVDILGRFAYAVNWSGDSISVYTIDQATGVLTAGTAVNAGTNPSSVTVDPTGRFAYAIQAGTKTISAYAIDQSTGALTAGSSVDIGTAYGSIAIDPSGRFAYAAKYDTNNVSAYTINKTTGALTAGGSVAAGSGPYAISVDPTGKFTYVANYAGSTVSVYTINQTTGALTAGTAVNAGTNPVSVTVDPSGKFAYTADYIGNTVSVFTINQSTGALTAGTAAAAGTNPRSVIVEPSGKFAYAVNSGSNNVSIYAIDQSTGALTGAATVSSGSGPRSITMTGAKQ